MYRIFPLDMKSYHFTLCHKNEVILGICYRKVFPNVPYKCLGVLIVWHTSKLFLPSIWKILMISSISSLLCFTRKEITKKYEINDAIVTSNMVKAWVSGSFLHRAMAMSKYDKHLYWPPRIFLISKWLFP